MTVDSKYTKSFQSNSLTDKKFSELYGFAIQIRNFKNELSALVSKDPLTYAELSKFEFLKKIRAEFPYKLPSSFDKQAIIQVLTAYKNKFDAIRHKLTFEVATFKGFGFYKRKTKKHDKGDFKKVLLSRQSTRLSVALTYLARYGSDSTVDYITSQIEKGDKVEFYQSILDCIEKYGFDRLYRLALYKRNRVLAHYTKKPIEFRSLTFSGRSRKKSIVGFNGNYNSVIDAFVSLSWDGRKSMDIPVKYARDYHGRMQEYQKATNDHEYVLTFSERRRQVSVNLYKDGQRYIPDVHGETIGIDVNCKHNLLSLSDGTTYDYDRKLLRDFTRLSMETDRLKKAYKDYTIGRRRQRKLNVLKLKMVKSEQNLIASMCKRLQGEGVGHIVMEDLDNGFGKCYVKDRDNEEINYNRKVKFLGLSSIKDKVGHIARKYGIAVSTVHSSYTSKMCPVCGCIEDENRPDQETFCCIECGHSENADVNAARNIRNRVAATVLQQKLLKQLDNGAFEPKKLRREKVKEVLLSFRRSLRAVGSECTNCSVTTFDYV